MRKLPIAAVAVCLLWSIVNPIHERRIGRSGNPHRPVLRVRNHALGSLLDDEAFEPPLAAEFVWVAASQRCELFLVAEEPARSSQHVPGFGGTRQHVGQHGVGGQELNVAQHLCELRLAVGPHRTNKSPAGKTLR